jgi:DNA polymerase III alpha subunit
MSNNQIVPVFTSHHSIGRSLLTVEKASVPRGLVSILDIAKKHSLEKPLIIDSDISSFWQLFKNAKEAGQKYSYGCKIWACEDEADETGETDSRISIIFKNDQAYYDFVKISSRASTVGYKKGRRRISWRALQDLWTDNFYLCVPFYNSFLARNNLVYNSRAVPSFGKIRPIFFLEDHSLPFDAIIRDAVLKYTEENGYDTMAAHQVYYYRNEDVKSLTVLKCITNRSATGGATLERPELPHFSSDRFSFQSWCEKNSVDFEVKIN